MGASDKCLSDFDREFLSGVGITTPPTAEFPNCPTCGPAVDLYHRLNHCQNCGSPKLVSTDVQGERLCLTCDYRFDIYEYCRTFERL